MAGPRTHLTPMVCFYFCFFNQDGEKLHPQTIQSNIYGNWIVGISHLYTDGESTFLKETNAMFWMWFYTSYQEKKYGISSKMSARIVFSFTYLIITRINEILAFWGIWMTLSCKNFFLSILYPEFQASSGWWFHEGKQGVSVREGHLGIMTSGSFAGLQQRVCRTSFHTGGLLDFTEFKRF